MKNFGCLFLVLLAFLGVGSCSYAYHMNENVYENIMVRNLDRECSGSGDSQSCKYMIYTDVGVFENEDSLIQMKFNSADVQNSMTVGNYYNITTVGWRVPFLSMFPNVIEVESTNQ